MRTTLTAWTRVMCIPPGSQRLGTGTGTGGMISAIGAILTAGWVSRWRSWLPYANLPEIALSRSQERFDARIRSILAGSAQENF